MCQQLNIVFAKAAIWKKYFLTDEVIPNTVTQTLLLLNIFSNYQLPEVRTISLWLQSDFFLLLFL